MTARQIELMRGVATFFLAVIPASALMGWAGFGAFMSFLTLLDGEFVAALFLLWCLAGIAGTLALWALLLRQRQAVVAAGLVVGILAILPLSFIVASAAIEALLDGSVRDASRWEILWSVWGLSLPSTAIYWLARGDWGIGSAP